MESNFQIHHPLSEGLPPNEIDDADLDEEAQIAAVPLTHREKDTHLYNIWAQNKTKENMSNLVNHLKPILYKEVIRAGTSLPKSVLEGEATVWAIKGIKSYSPDKGAALSTWVSNYVQKLRRLNYEHQNAARMPENQQLQYRHYNKAVVQLSDLHNREPTEEEIAHELGWSKGQVVNYKKLLYEDHFEGKSEHASEFEHYSDNAILLREIMGHLTPEEKYILDHKGSMSSTELAKKLGIDINRLNYIQRKLVTKITALKKEVGMD